MGVVFTNIHPLSLPVIKNREYFLTFAYENKARRLSGVLNVMNGPAISVVQRFIYLAAGNADIHNARIIFILSKRRNRNIFRFYYKIQLAPRLASVIRPVNFVADACVQNVIKINIDF